MAPDDKGEPRLDSITRFERRATAYAAFRPSYPPEAVDAVLDSLGDPQKLTIAEIGAGTGIAARLFAERGACVIAIEPNQRMRSQAQPHPNVRWCDGTAQRTGLGDASVDLVLACQAFHWFATPEVMAEFRRVARGRAALLAYERDERDAFTKAYGDLVRSYATDDTEALRRRALVVFAGFPDARIARTAAYGVQRLDRDALLGRAASSSYLPAEGPRQAALARDLNALFERFQRGGSCRLKIVTHAMTADW